jgi:hypothetical protein
MDNGLVRACIAGSLRMTGSLSGEKPRDSKVDRTSKKDQKAETRVSEKGTDIWGVNPKQSVMTQIILIQYGLTTFYVRE